MNHGRRTVCANPLGWGCVVDLYTLLDIFNACKGRSGKWQGEQVDAICFGGLDDLLDTGRVVRGCVGSRCSWDLRGTQNISTAKEKSTKNGPKVHHYERATFLYKRDAMNVFRLLTKGGRGILLKGTEEME